MGVEMARRSPTCLQIARTTFSIVRTVCHDWGGRLPVGEQFAIAPTAVPDKWAQKGPSYCGYISALLWLALVARKGRLARAMQHIQR